MFLSVSSLGYKKESVQINLIQQSKEVVKNFLMKEEATLLKEVQVAKEVLPIMNEHSFKFLQISFKLT